MKTFNEFFENKQKIDELSRNPGKIRELVRWFEDRGIYLESWGQSWVTDTSKFQNYSGEIKNLLHKVEDEVGADLYNLAVKEVDAPKPNPVTKAHLETQLKQGINNAFQNLENNLLNPGNFYGTVGDKSLPIGSQISTDFGLNPT